MYIVTRERELAQASAMSGALAIVDLANWQIDRSLPVLSKPFRDYLHIADSQLLLVPSIEPSRADQAIVGRGMREARCDALVVKASSGDRRTLYCAVGEWQRYSNVWHQSRRLWLSRSNEAWLVPDPAETGESKAVFPLKPGRLRISAVPPAYDWGCPCPGFDRADAYIAAVWGDRA